MLTAELGSTKHLWNKLTDEETVVIHYYIDRYEINEKDYAYNTGWASVDRESENEAFKYILAKFIF